VDDFVPKPVTSATIGTVEKLGHSGQAAGDHQLGETKYEAGFLGTFDANGWATEFIAKRAPDGLRFRPLGAA
jgi:hypothetical protein